MSLPHQYSYNGPAVLLENDYVIDALDLFSAGSDQPTVITLDPNVKAAAYVKYANYDRTGHNFINSYLYYSDTRDWIVDEVKTGFASVSSPTMEDYLYEIKVETDSILSSYYLPVGDSFTQYYDLSSNEFPWIYNFEWVSGNNNDYQYHNIAGSNYNPTGLIASSDALGYVDQTNVSGAITTETFTITQCNRPSTTENYALQAHYVVDGSKWGRRDLNVLSSAYITTSVYDRYGDLINSRTNTSFAGLYSWGWYIPMDFSQDDLYDTEQKAVLSQYKLSGTYELGAEIYYPLEIWID